MTARLCACILIGGKSKRMGSPKHRLSYRGKTWFEIIYRQLVPVCDEVIVAGQGELPPGNWRRVNDVPTCKGPLAGVLAAMESTPQANFIVCSCDIPFINSEAVQWLLAQVECEDWAVLPSLNEHFVEPLFAYYDHRLLPVLQALANDTCYKLSQIVSHDRVKVVRPPIHLQSAWKNCNTPQDAPVS